MRLHHILIFLPLLLTAPLRNGMCREHPKSIIALWWNVVQSLHAFT